MSAERVCNECHLTKSLDDFYQYKTTAGGVGYETKCKQCRLAKQKENDLANFHNNAVVDLSGDKRCAQCGTVKSKSEFVLSRRSASGVTSACKECLARNYGSLEGQIANRLSTSKARARDKGMAFDLDKEFILELWQKQEGRCALTGVDIRPGDVGTPEQHGPYTLSIDRIDHSKGYIKDNVRLLCHAANVMRGSWTDQDVLDTLLACLRHQGYTVEKRS